MPPKHYGDPLPVPTSREERTMGMLCHVAGLATFIGIPFGGILGALFVYLARKDRFPFVEDQGRESLNFQITLFIAMICCVPLVFVGIGILLLPIIAVAGLICTIIGAVTAGSGRPHRYPISLRVIK